MNWTPISSTDDLTLLAKRSFEVPCLIFKHSVRCNISFMAKHRLEQQWAFDESEIIPFYLDLIQFREISNLVSDKFQVYHESPQILVIKDGECVLDASHLDIHVDEVREVLS